MSPMRRHGQTQALTEQLGIEAEARLDGLYMLRTWHLCR